MKEYQDYFFIPQIIVNDVLNTGQTIKGSAYLTKKYFFVLPTRVENMGGVISKMNFDANKLKDLVSKIDAVEPGMFELSMMEIVPAEFIMHFANFDKFEVNVGFFIFGGVKIKVKGKRLQSASVGNTTMRQQLKDFVSDIKIG